MFYNSICSLGVSMSHFGNSCNISNVLVIIFKLLHLHDETLIDVELLLMNGQRKCFFEMFFTPSEDSVKIVEMTTKDLEYFINLVDKTVAGFERIDSNFERSATSGKILSNSRIYYQETIHGGISGWLSGLAPAFSPGRDPGVLGSSPTSGSLHGACFSFCLSLSLSVSHVSFFKSFYLFIHERCRERGRDTGREKEAGSMQGT